MFSQDPLDASLGEPSGLEQPDDELAADDSSIPDLDDVGDFGTYDFRCKFEILLCDYRFKGQINHQKLHYPKLPNLKHHYPKLPHQKIHHPNLQHQKIHYPNLPNLKHQYLNLQHQKIHHQINQLPNQKLQVLIKNVLLSSLTIQLIGQRRMTNIIRH